MYQYSLTGNNRYHFADALTNSGLDMSDPASMEKSRDVADAAVIQKQTEIQTALEERRHLRAAEYLYVAKGTLVLKKLCSSAI